MALREIQLSILGMSPLLTFVMMREVPSWAIEAPRSTRSIEPLHVT